MVTIKFSLALLCFFSSNTLAQNWLLKFSESYGKAISKINNGVVHYTITSKSYFKQNTKTSHNVLYFSHPNPSCDSMYFVLVRENGSMCLYNMDSVYFYNPPSNELVISRQQWTSVKAKLFQDLVPLLTRSDNIFQIIQASSHITSSSLEDTFISQKKYIKISFDRIVSMGDTLLPDPSEVRVITSMLFESDSFLPVRYSSSNYWKNDSALVQVDYDSISINTMGTYTLLKAIFDTLNTLRRDGVNEKEGVTSNVPPKKLLDSNSTISNIVLSSTPGTQYHLYDVKADLLLLDFWYIACAPCQLAIPVLNRLHSKYKNRGLKIIGIDPFDDLHSPRGKANIATNNIEYELSYADRETVEKEFNISGYPTLYLIDKNKKVVFSTIGFGRDSEEELDAVIEKYLR